MKLLILSAFLLFNFSIALAKEQDKNDSLQKMTIGRWKIHPRPYLGPCCIELKADSTFTYYSASFSKNQVYYRYKYFVREDTLFLTDSSATVNYLYISEINDDSLILNIWNRFFFNYGRVKGGSKK